MDWDEYFMLMTYFVSLKSKDQSTHIGAIIIGLDHEMRSSGYNSFPRGINDYVEERQERPEKYYWFEHAERNAIYNAARVGVPLKNCIMYTQGIPCADCARAIIQSGIKEVVVHEDWISETKFFEEKEWNASHKCSEIMLKEAGVEIRYFKGKLSNKLNCFVRGSEIESIWKTDQNLEGK